MTPIPGFPTKEDSFSYHVGSNPLAPSRCRIKNLFQFYFIPFRGIFYDPDQEASFYNRVLLAFLFKEISPDWD